MVLPHPSNIRESSPVREFTGDTRRMTHSVLNELVRERARLVEELGTIELKTFEEYRYRRGQIIGLDIAIKICKDIQAQLEA